MKMFYNQTAWLGLVTLPSFQKSRAHSRAFIFSSQHYKNEGEFSMNIEPEQITRKQGFHAEKIRNLKLKILKLLIAILLSKITT